MRKFWFLPCLMLLVPGATAFATSFVLPPDDRMVDRAALIGYGTLLGSDNVSVGSRPYTDHRFRFERVLKGEAAAGEIVSVRVLGGTNAEGMTLKIWGAPEFRRGARALLFLSRHEDGTFRPFQVVLGHFHEAVVDGQRLWVRDLSEVDVVAAKAGEEGDPAAGLGRDFDRFADWIADRAAGRPRSPDYRRELPAGALAAAFDKFTFLGGSIRRWFQFESGQQVSWLADASGQPGLAGGGFSQFEIGINAWNTDPASNIRYRYQGTTATLRGFNRDGANVISFQDYDNDIDFDFECISLGNGSGVLAIGGPWTLINDSPPIPIREADIVVNTGSGCWFNNSGPRAAQVYAHELGHTLGLGHSCGDSEAGPCDTPLETEAVMRANAHRDERGAALNDDDRAGALALYPGGTPIGPYPLSPSNLAGLALFPQAVSLTWQDNAGDETSYHVDRRFGSLSFEEVAELNPGATSHLVTGLTPGWTYTFRVRARNETGFSAPSNTVTVTTPTGPPATGFYTVSPCRLLDTRNPSAPSGGPSFAASGARNLPVAGRCGVPPEARSVVLNVTGILPISGGNLRLFPAGLALPDTSVLNFRPGQVRAVSAVATLGHLGEIALWNDSPGTLHLVIDITGYFVE